MTINFVAVLVAALAAFAVGGVWYSESAFARTWRMAAHLPAREPTAHAGLTYGLSLALLLIAALTLDALTGGRGSAFAGAAFGFTVGAGLLATSLGVIYLFEGRSFALWRVNAGYLVVSFSLMGAVVGGWE